MKKRLAIPLALLLSSQAHSATFTLGGDITDGAGTVFGTYVVSTAASVGFGAIDIVEGPDGLLIDFGNDSATGDVATSTLTITSGPGWILDSVILSQFNSNTGYTGNGGIHNGNTDTPASTVDYTFAGASSSFTEIDPDNQITSPVAGTALTFSQIPQELNNSVATWEVSLNGASDGAYTHSHTTSQGVNLFRETIAWDATFVAIPEPSSSLLLSLSALGLVCRRSRR